LKLGPAWSSPAERQQWERRLNARIDAQIRKQREVPDEGTFAKIGSRVYRDRRIKAAMPFISIIVQWCRAGEKPFTDEYQSHVADKLGVTERTVRRWQRIADEAEMIKTDTRRGRGRRNRYTVLPAALPPPIDPGAPTRRRRRSVKPDKNVRSPLTDLKPTVLDRSSPPVPLPASGKGVCGPSPASAPGQPRRVKAEPAPVPRAAVSARGQKATPAPAELASPIKRARQGASAMRVRAPP